MSFLAITYWNSSDVGGMWYHNSGYKNRMYFDTTPALADVLVVEEGEEDGDKEPVITFRKTTKLYKCDIVCTYEQMEALYFIQHHDNIWVKLKNEEKAKVSNWTVTKDEDLFGGHMAKVTFQFTISYTLKTSLCDNMLTSCYVPTLVQCIDVLTSMPPRVNVRDGRYLITAAGYNDIYECVANVFTQQYEANEGQIVLAGGNKYYFDGDAWKKYPVMLTLVKYGAYVISRGWVLPNTFVQLQQYTITGFVNVGTPILGSVFQTTGLRYNYGGFAGKTSFRIHSYSHGCDYGYSNNINIQL